MHHIFQQKSEKSPVLILLHGTGGDERSLLNLATALNPDASILSLRGDVNEGGMLRFFKRKAEGIYDIEDLHYRGQKMLEFLHQASQQYQFDLSESILVGFSNGSNIAINLLLSENTPLKYGLLFAPMYPVEVPQRDLTNTKVFVSTGKHDPIVPIEESDYVVKLFKDRNAQVTQHWVNSHEINNDAFNAAKQFLETL